MSFYLNGFNDSFKYLRSTFVREKEATNRITRMGSRWREMSGVICDKNVHEVLKNRIYKDGNDVFWGMFGDEEM